MSDTTQYRKPLSTIPTDLVSVADYARYAPAFIPHAIMEYIAGGGADELSLKRNRSALDALQILPRALVDCTAGGTHTQVLGERLRHPLLLAPVAFQTLVHPEGELATADAASVLETGMVTSTLSSVSLEAIAARCSADFTLQLVRRAEAAGYTQLMVTVDAPLHGIRNRAQRAGYELPPGVEAVNLKDRPPLPSASFEPSQSIVFQGMMSEVPNWDDIAWLQQQTRLPITLKGLLHPADVQKAQQMGLAGAVISNHGGRTLDSVPSPIDLLPSIRQAVGADFALLMDGGIERGTDVFKAIALGANAVLLGRPQLYALAVAGKLGVAHMLRILREELEVSMALAGTATIADITPASLWRASP